MEWLANKFVNKTTFEMRTEWFHRRPNNERVNRPRRVPIVLRSANGTVTLDHPARM